MPHRRSCASGTLARAASALLETETLEEAEIERVKREIVRVPAPPPLPEKPQIAAAVPAS
jgi:hypothetical protein